MLVKAVVKAHKEHEIVNTSLDGNEIVFHEEVNSGIVSGEATHVIDGLVYYKLR